jgi:glycosyltransferase involved in cell wall biosynthesis
MRLLFCSEFFYPEIGGVEEHMKIFAEYFKNKYEIHIATSYNHQRTKYQINKFNIHQFNITGNFVRGYKGNINQYQNFLIDSNFDLIIFYASQQWTFDLSLEVLKKIKSKKIFIPCGFSKLNNFLYKPYFFILKNELNHFDEIITFSKKYQDYFFCKKYYKKRINIIYNGARSIKKNKIKNYIKNKLKLKKNFITFLSIGSLKFMKGADLAINTISKIKNENIILIIICQKIKYNFYYLYLKLLILKLYFLSKKKIVILDKVSQKIKNNFFYNSDYFIHTSRIECSPLVLFESFANKKIFFGRNVGNTKEIIDKHKIGYTSNSIKDLSVKINEYIFKNKHNNPKLKNNIYKIFKKNYDWNMIMKKYEKVFNKALT